LEECIRVERKKEKEHQRPAASRAESSEIDSSIERRKRKAERSADNGPLEPFDAARLIAISRSLPNKEVAALSIANASV